MKFEVNRNGVDRPIFEIEVYEVIFRYNSSSATALLISNIIDEFGDIEEEDEEEED